ncbi:hypothetical protein [Enterobacter asburiae]|uniref:hypothetical protein n=1 Tax=Enterobacter asburiae TaxID=61645 RepID=UPI001D0F5AC8|nr:hypothetical protein [Enterobacter asburiae]MCC2914055.1 hypothetical protein [Enterobacter asburiae]
MNVIAAGIFCFIFYPTAFAYACYKKRWLEWIFLTLIIIFASAISIQQYNEANFVSELNYPMFISAIYGLSLAWFPFPIAYVVLRFLLGVLGIFRPKTTKCSGGPAVCGLQRGITFFEIPIWALFE